ncbi:MAG: pyridoxal-phosphate dependent enzyme, partial [Nitrososphaerota archaeon]
MDSIRLYRGFFKNRPRTLWRYHELLPIKDKTKIVDLGAGYTPLHNCDRLARKLGIRKLYIKDDTMNPTNSFKDRPATVAVSKALEFGFKNIGCVST